jgi:hypothetical protein
MRQPLVDLPARVVVAPGVVVSFDRYRAYAYPIRTEIVDWVLWKLQTG